ncbi:MAG TPA: glycosyl transferase [Cyanobacteria bacterium UBA8543]|nr:glycosyl transferase [Cyanobacteria bacterium UBA8543]
MIKVFMPCSGLGNVKRGFESFTQECFETILQEKSFDVTLFKGGGDSLSREIALWNLPRESWMAIQLGKLLARITKKGEEPGKVIGKEKKEANSAYFVEQLTFFFSFLPYVNRSKPDVIYFSDVNLGSMLWYWRNLTKQPYKLLFCNGGPLPPPFPRWDYVHQVAPIYFQLALSAGEPVEKLILVPYGISMSPQLHLVPVSERETLRRRLGLPKERPLLLSVAAINKSHKRMDYVIREVASLPEPRPYLLLVGQQDFESPEILQLGNKLLGAAHFQIRTVAQNEVAKYYTIADAFVLGSLTEGLPRVLLEAMSYGLPCLVHDYEIARFVVGEEGYFGNFELTGSLASLIPKALAEGYEVSKRDLRYRSAYDRFSWEKLRSCYVEMIQGCTASPEAAKLP